MDMSTNGPIKEPGTELSRGAANKHVVIPLLLAVVGSVAGTLVSKAVDTTQGYALLGAGLGAAIPPVIAVVGPFAQLRLVAGVVIAAGAVAFTYVGFTVPQEALGTTTTFPVPGSGPESESTTAPPPPDTSSPPPTEPGARTCERNGRLCISWSPRQLHCSTNPCAPDVTVQNTGTDDLRITGHDFRGDGKERLSGGDGCDDTTLQEQESCTITVLVNEGPPGHAQLRIHQNLKGPASVVDIDVDQIGPESVDLSLSTPRCRVEPGGGTDNGDVLTVDVTVVKSGNLPDPVPVRLSSKTGLTGGPSSDQGNDLTQIPVALSADDYGRSHLVTLTVDPDDNIAEQDESNNALDVTVWLPTGPNEAGDVRCDIS